MLDAGAIGAALAQAFSMESFIGVGGGVLLGYMIGVIPGLSRGMAVAIAIPLTFYMSPYVAISFLIGLSKGSTTGSAITAILLNAPGEPSSAVTCYDGYPMAREGRPRRAMKISLFASVIGDLIATIFLIIIVIPFARVALMFGPYEMAAILVFTLVFIAGMSGGSLFKGLAAGGLGVFLGTIGLDPQTGLPRMTFGITDLMDGVPLLAVAIGTLALGEMFHQSDRLRTERDIKPVSLAKNPHDTYSLRDLIKDMPAIMKGTAIGIFVGVLPGLGPTIASFMAYGWAKNSSKHPEKFGKGASEGIAASESSDNAVIPAALVPLFGLGIPGNVSAALLIGAFAIHGITVGPLLLREEPELLYSIFAGMLLASAIMLAVGWIGLMFFARIALVPPHAVIAVVIWLCLAGSALQGYGMFGLLLLFFFAVLGYLMKRFDYSFVTFLVAFILTPMLELNLRQSIILSRGDPWVLLNRPIAVGFIILTLIALVLLIRSTLKNRAKKKRAPKAEAAVP